MYSHPERTEEDMPDTITYAVLGVDGGLRFTDVPSNPEFKEDSYGFVSLIHTGPWKALDEETGAPRWSSGKLAREVIGKGLTIWVADQSLVPDELPMNEVGARTVNILAKFAQGERYEDQEWAGTIVITGQEDRGDDRWAGFVWPLDEEQKWLIEQAWL